MSTSLDRDQARPGPKYQQMALVDKALMFQ